MQNPHANGDNCVESGKAVCKKIPQHCPLKSNSNHILPFLFTVKNNVNSFYLLLIFFHYQKVMSSGKISRQAELLRENKRQSTQTFPVAHMSCADSMMLVVLKSKDHSSI